MKFAMACGCSALALIAVSAQRPSDSTRAIVTSYLEIQDQLASDHFENVKGPAKTLAAQAVALGNEGTSLAKAAAAFEKAADIKAARAAFGPLSTAVIERVKADGSKEAAADLRLAYCPMAGNWWLQREERLRNPYYGTAMLTCGEFKPLK